jgi:hypothetical protein
MTKDRDPWEQVHFFAKTPDQIGNFSCSDFMTVLDSLAGNPVCINHLKALVGLTPSKDKPFMWWLDCEESIQDGQFDNPIIIFGGHTVEPTIWSTMQDTLSLCV